MLLDIVESGGGRREELQQKLWNYLEKRGVEPFSVLSHLFALVQACSETIESKPLPKSCTSPKGAVPWKQRRKELQPDDAP